jgi:thiamine pyrophosphokinase
VRGFRAILVGNAPEKGIPARLRALKPGRADLLIAVDGGLKHCLAAKHAPDLAIGDFDSFRVSKVPRDVRRIVLSADKDRSDFYYALQTALVIGASDIVALGFSGGRTDHALAALLDLSEVSQAKGLRSVELRAAGETSYFLSASIPTWRAKLARGTCVSVLALSNQVTGARWRGFKYAPAAKGFALAPGSRGLSNQALGGEATLSIHNGRAMVMVQTR